MASGANVVTITQDDDEKWSVRLERANGQVLEIDGLDEWRFALAWSHMHLSWPNGYRG